MQYTSWYDARGPTWPNYAVEPIRSYCIFVCRELKIIKWKRKIWNKLTREKISITISPQLIRVIHHLLNSQYLLIHKGETTEYGSHGPWPDLIEFIFPCLSLNDQILVYPNLTTSYSFALRPSKVSLKQSLL